MVDLENRLLEPMTKLVTVVGWTDLAVATVSGLAIAFEQKELLATFIISMPTSLILCCYSMYLQKRIDDLKHVKN